MNCSGVYFHKYNHRDLDLIPLYDQGVNFEVITGN